MSGYLFADLFGECGEDGAMLVGKIPDQDLPPIARKFKDALKERGWTPSRLHREAKARFGTDAAVAQSFRRLIGVNAPESDNAKAAIQAETILFPRIPDEHGIIEENANPTLTIEQMAGNMPTASAIVPLIGHIPAARDATEEQIVAESRRLMNSRHASLHALLTLLLAQK